VKSGGKQSQTDILEEHVAYIFREQTLFATCFHAGFFLGLSLPLKMEAKLSYETSVDFQRTTRHYISQDKTLQSP
jgi:hypothetical protein